jgi:hypothetical protein
LKDTFTSQHVIRKLVDHYGLPAFLFDAVDETSFTIKGDKKMKTVCLVKYDTYGNLNSLPKKAVLLFEDQWRTKTDVLASRISWHAGYHEKTDARACIVVKASKEIATTFLEKNHLMGYAGAAYHYALIHDKQIIAVAAFSKGRKMDRLKNDQRSFELVRFATIPFVSITGGLSKLLNAFATEHKPGDIMTYIDPLSGETESLKRLGFEEIERTKPVELFVNTQTHTRNFNHNSKNELSFFTLGNHKLVKPF